MPCFGKRICFYAWFLGLLVWSGWAMDAPLKLENRLAPDQPELRSILSAERPDPDVPFLVQTHWTNTANAFGVIAVATRQPIGALSGRVVFMNGGHGWTYDTNFPWRLLRGIQQEMNEDYGNLDQLNFFAAYCFNAGAVVVPFRPLGQQTYEMVLDNDDPGVVFTGSWAKSSSTLFYGKSGDVPYRYANLDSNETATVAYTPTIPLTGYYPVYTWVAHGANRGDQLYRIRHTGGESQVRIPHYMVGNGWVYLGEYYLNAGSNASIGSVIISNLRSTTNGSVVIADAIRFGNGMGSINRGEGVSGYPREDESCRYWIQNSVGQGQSASLYDGTGDDESDGWSAPPKMSAEMNREAYGSIYKRIHISFHSNAGGGRGTVGLITGNPTPNQASLAQIAGKEVNDDLVALGSPPLETNWYNRTTVTYTGGYSEIDGSLFNDEMDATILEVAFHDSADDAKLLRDPKARAAVGKAAMHAVVKYMNQFDTNNPVLLNFLPEPPTNLRAIASSNGLITLSWTAPVRIGGSQNPTNYVIYRSTNGYGFGNPISVSNVLTCTVSNLAPEVDYYFRVSAANAGGESMPSAVVGCRAASLTGLPRVLYVNAFERFDRTTNLRQDTTRQSYDPPGASGTIERVWPRRINAFDYVVPHGKAISSFGMAFDSCQNEAITNGTVMLSNYPVIIWACGQESTENETFNSTEQAKVTEFLNAGGGLFVSGSEIGWDLDRASGPTAGDRAFYNNQLHAEFGSNTNDDSGIYTVVATNNALFAGNGNATFDNGTKGIYWVQTPDILLPNGTGTRVALTYTGTTNAAAIQYDGSAGGGRVVYLAFPFETITSSSLRNTYMADVLNFLQPAKITIQPSGAIVAQGTNVQLAVTATGAAPLVYQWRCDGIAISGVTNASLVLTNLQTTNSGNYSVVVTNAGGKATSSVAFLTVYLPQPLHFEPLGGLSGLSSNQIHLRLQYNPASPVTIEASGDFLQWVALTNYILSNGVQDFMESLTNRQRFYRARSP